MSKNIDLENSSYADIKSILSKLTWKSWFLLFSGFSLVVTTLIAVGFINFPWINTLKIKENNSASESNSYELRVAKIRTNKLFFRRGYLHLGSSRVQSCINDYKKSFNEVGAELIKSTEDEGLILATLNGHLIYAYCYVAEANKINSHAVLYANGEGGTFSEAQKSANLAGVNLDSVISHLKNVQPL